MLKVLSFNTSSWNNPIGIQKHSSLIAEFLKSKNADFVFLCELAGNAQQTKTIANLSEYHYWVEIPSYPHHHINLAIGFLSRFKPAKYSVMRVMRCRKWWHNAVKIVLKNSKNKLCNVYGIHCWNNDLMNKNALEIIQIELSRNNNPRMFQINQIIMDYKNDDLPAIILGDLNTFPFSSTYFLLKKYFKDACPAIKSVAGTYNFKPNYPKPRLDYIWHTQNIKSQKYSILQNNISDHNAVETTIASLINVTEEGRGKNYGGRSEY